MSDHPGELGENELALRLDGVGVETTSIDTVPTLSLAAAWFRLVAKVASRERWDVNLVGLEVRSKCAQVVAFDTYRAGYAQRAAEMAAEMVRAPQVRAGFSEEVEVVRRALRRLDRSISVSIESAQRRVDLLPAEEPDGAPVVCETMEARAYVVAAGGRTPKVHLDVWSESRAFKLNAEPALAKALAERLYEHVDIVAHVERDARQRIVGGDLLEFHPLEAEGGFEAWQQWFAAAAPEWNAVEDVEAALLPDEP